MTTYTPVVSSASSCGSRQSGVKHSDTMIVAGELSRQAMGKARKALLPAQSGHLFIQS